MFEDLLSHLVSVLGAFIDQGENLRQALFMVRYDFGAAPGQIKKRLSMARENSASWQLSHFLKRFQVILQGVRAFRLRVEANVGGDAWQDVIGGKENAIFF